MLSGTLDGYSAGNTLWYFWVGTLILLSDEPTTNPVSQSELNPKFQKLAGLRLN